jgi:bifunctional diaminopimelate decarboxylase / aspartate kinase
MNWIVSKFGGTSVSSKTRWDTIRGIGAGHVQRGQHVLVVVSAVSGVTDMLKELIAMQATGSPVSPVHLEGYETQIGKVLARHQRHRDELGLVGVQNAHTARINKTLADFQKLALDAPWKPADDRSTFAWQAQLYAMGELLSSAFGVAYLSLTGTEAGFLDVRTVLTAQKTPSESAWASFLSCNCDITHDAALGDKIAALGQLVVTQGFIAQGAEGHTVILGRGGSDTSAAYLAARIGAAGVEIWTDVPGMFSANPHKVPQAHLLARLDYEEAQEIAATGAKVLHPRALAPVWERNIPLSVRDTTRPHLQGTRIETARPAEASGNLSIKAVSHRSGIVLVAMESLGMWQQVGFLSDIFSIFKKHGMSIDLIGTAETNVTVSLDAAENLLTDAALDALNSDLKGVCRTTLIRPCAAVTLVGRGIRSLLGRLRDLLAEIGDHNVHLITQSSNNLNFTVVVDEPLGEELAIRLHELLIASGAMSVENTEVFGPTWEELAKTKEASAPVELPFWQTRRAEVLELSGQGTPRYVYDLQTVKAQAQVLTGCTSLARVHFAIKANPHPEILQALEAEGVGFECVSIGELEHVFTVMKGLNPDRVLFTPNFAPEAEYQAAFARGVHVTIDNLQVLAHWQSTLRGQKVLLRFDLGHGHGHHDKVRTGGSRSKFGIALAEASEAKRLADRAGAKIVGLHAHLGSGVVEASHWAKIGRMLTAELGHFPDARALNIGGGFGVPYKDGDARLDISALKKELQALREEVPPNVELWCEPGRFLVASAGALLVRVTQMKEKAGVHFVGVDGGMNALIRPALYDAFHKIVNLTRVNEADQDKPVTVVGPICESGDVLGTDRRLPPCQVGDCLLVATTGAYGHAMASTYNLRPLPLETVLSQDPAK